MLLKMEWTLPDFSELIISKLWIKKYGELASLFAHSYYLM